MQNLKNRFVLVFGFLVCLLIRLIPFRPPNIEPILATTMPFARHHGPVIGFLFAFLSIVLYDLLTLKIGVWTWITALLYGLLGLTASFYFKNRFNRARSYVSFAIIATLAYDALTGLTIGPLFFRQPFMAALIGQIPFTVLHLLGNVLFAAILSPALYTYLIENRKLEKFFTSSINFQNV